MTRRGRVPRGKFGASILNGMITIDIDVPLSVALDLDKAKLVSVVGNRVARTVRKRLRAGLDGDGAPAHQPRDGTPFKSSGRLIRDLRYNKRAGVVAPSTRTRSDATSDRVKSSYAIMMVGISGAEDWEWRDPMGSFNDAQHADAMTGVEQELQKQLDKGALVGKRAKPRVGRRGGRRGRR